MKWMTRRLALALVALVAAGVAGCHAGHHITGTFEKTFTLDGPVRLELQNTSGRARIATGPAGVVHIRGEFKMRGWAGSSHRRVATLTSNPPVQQDHNLIRIGFDGIHGLEVNYTIEVPAETEVHATGTSSDLDLSGIRGPATLTTHSGDITAEQIGGDVRITSGSGDIRLVDIKGEVEISTGSGDLTLRRIAGEVRISTGSGDVSIDQPGGAMTAKTGRGDVRIMRAAGDLRVHTGSGDVRVDGDPASGAFWEFYTGSGDVILRVPQQASFRFRAHSDSSRIRTDIPLVIEEQSRHDWRARIGQGSARVEVQTMSGEIHVE